ncbi:MULTISPECIES: methyl-accepting chemotaxis protein [Bacillales]|uniref:methyl-accepting chemotaxis protein n=1 Tax=Bacillales TaxID=1385 RepID=UPI000366CEA8|nr:MULTISPECIES: methyl-accepting chemotaxis protein [Bacillales]KMZ43454.1 chemotaxis protein [Bacillus sp. FJAT-27238]
MNGKLGSITRGTGFSLRTKLLAAFLTVVALLAFVSIFALSQIRGLTMISGNINESWMPTVTLLGTLNGDISDVERLALDIIVEKNEEKLKKQQEVLDQLLVKIEDERKQMKTIVYASYKEGSEVANLFEEFSSKYDAYLEKMPEFVKLGRENKYDEASKLHSVAYQFWYEANDNIKNLTDIYNEGAGEVSQSASELSQQAFVIILVSTSVAAVIALLIAFFMAHIISKPVQKMNQAAVRIASGDLTGEMIVLRNKDELGTLAASFNTMTANLRAMIESVATTSEQVAASSEELLANAEQNAQASEQISQTVEELAVGTSEQVNIVKNSSQAMGEMALSSEQIAQLAQSVSVSAVDAAKQSEEGNMIIKSAVEQMSAVRNSITSLSELVMGLGERSAEIGTITEVINNLASQTNLLALNAAIEAARAGEHGRGFAVVAEEVRKLAEESSLSAQRITDLVQLIQNDTRQAVEAVKMNSDETRSGMEIVTAAGQAFENISNAVNKVAGEIQEVSAGAEQMAASADEVVNYVEQISAIAEEASSGVHNVSAATEQQQASTEEIASSADSLSKMAEELQEQINKFKV